MSGRWTQWIPVAVAVLAIGSSSFSPTVGDESVKKSGSKPRTYENKLTLLKNPQPLLGDYPEFVEPVKEINRYEAPLLLDDEDADLSVRAWRFSYNARGIVEMPNRLCARNTAVVMVHPWGIDDGQGWTTPEPAGVCDFGTPTKNHLAAEHTRGVINPLLKRLRGRAGVVAMSLPGKEDPIRQKLYRSVRSKPTATQREEGKQELDKKLRACKYEAEPIPATFELTGENTVQEYFKNFPGVDASAKYNGEGFWELPIPVTSDIDVYEDDVVVYDAEGYEIFRDFLKSQGIRNVILVGYATDMCFCKTTAGYENLSPDFNVFLVGDATLATYPANDSPRFATNAHISYAALTHLVTQVSWIKLDETTTAGK